MDEMHDQLHSYKLTKKYTAPQRNPLEQVYDVLIKISFP
jgi:hypothetical protein